MTDTVLKAFLFSDLVGSVDLKRRLGDAAGADLISKHDAVAHACAAQYGASDFKDMGDGFLATFDVPSNAVLCALAFQKRIAELDAAEPLEVRMGVHLGETVSLKDGESKEEDKLVGLAVDTTARLMGLAQGRQILLSRGAFDSSRQQILESFDGKAIQWLAHGNYFFKGIDEQVDVYEVGIEGFSSLEPPPDSEKAKRAVAPGTEDTLGWRPAAGLSIPGRGHWVLVEQIGEGGYGEVWLASHDKTKEKRVFKFCFDSERLRGLRREVVLLRLLRESLGDRDDIAQVLEWEFEKPPFFLEAEYTEGGDLKDWAERKGGIEEVPLETRLELVAQTATALGAAHSVGVLHKDVKPANILIAEHAETGQPRVRLTDFGIGLITNREALEARGITAAGLTETLVSSKSSSGSGTRMYLAPELIEDKPPTTLSDIYSLGVVLYQMVIGDLSRSVAPGWERDVDDELLREDIAACVDGIPERRLPDALELADRLRNMEDRRALRTAERRTMRRRKVAGVAVASALILALIATAGFWQLRRGYQARVAREETIPRVIELIEQDNYFAALDLAREAERYLPDDLGLAQLWPRMSAEYSIETTPPGADVYFKPYKDLEGEWRLIGRSPTATMRLPLGVYRWSVEKDGFDTLELARVVTKWDNSTYPKPKALNFELNESGSLPDAMLSARGGNYPNPIVGGIPPPPADLAPYLVDRYEVTNKEFKEFLDSGGYEDPKFWKHEFSKDGQTLSWEEAMILFRDSTGRTAPASWAAGRYPEGQDDYPVGGVSWYEAAAYAEFRGLSLPTVYHWALAALDGNEHIAAMTPSIVSLSNLAGKGPASVGGHAAIGASGASDFAGNVREWCSNAGGNGRYCLGGGWSDPRWMVTSASTFSPWDRSPINGFRCVKYNENDGPAASLLARIDFPPLVDPSEVDPVSPEVFQVYLDRFSYEKTPLDPVTDRPDVQSKSWTEETVTIDAAYGGERLPIHFALPKETAAPYQALIMLGGGEILVPHPFDDEYLEQFSEILDSGRALIMPVFSGTYDRSNGQTMARLYNPRAVFDVIVEWGKDLSRTIDYLEQRPDIDATKLGYLGVSMGAIAGVCAPLLAAEPRIKVAVLQVGGFSPQESGIPRTLAFLERVHVPLILMSGRYDHVFPLEIGQKPFMALLGTPEEHKRHVVYESGHHPLPRYESSQEALAWLDRYLGPVTRF